MEADSNQAPVVVPVTSTEQLFVAQPNAVVPPPSEPDNSETNKKLFVFGGAVAVLLILVVGFAFAFTQTQKPGGVTEEPTPTSGAWEEEMAGWKTYEDGTIRVQYPGDLDDSTQEQGTALVLLKMGPTQREGTELYDGISLRFRVLEVSGATPLELAERNISQDEPIGVEVVKDPEPININGYSGVAYTLRGLGEHTYIILQGPDSMSVEIANSSVDPGNLGYENTIDQILSTFEFVD